MNKIREASSMLGDIALGCVTLGVLLFAVAAAGGLIITAITELLIYPVLAPTLGSLGLPIQPGAI